ncbi:MAG: class I SAM-dependent methyltransferase [Chloroflexi bacterium]|nr:class I SAM-dependent methyltransferase [Chloroflexota bacterium]
MNLLDLLHRASPPVPWAEGDKIPWNDPDFSRRMLREHLSQAHDAASRRSIIIDEHVDWIHRAVLHNRSSRVLDLGCGPGLYSSRLAQRGHTCVGIDFGPASIEYARDFAQAQQLACEYHLADVRDAEYGAGYDLAMFVFGESNVFRPEDLQRILSKAYAALNDGGHILLEVHTLEVVQRLGHQRATWYSLQQGLFSDRPHLVLFESFWDEAQRVAIERFYIVDAETAEVTQHSSSMQAYTDEQYRYALQIAGFMDITFYPSLIGAPDERQPDLIAIVASR